MSELSEELRLTKSELEEKRMLNEKLELDLLQLEMHKPTASSSTVVDSPRDGGISDLDLMGKKSPPVSGRIWCRLCLDNKVPLSQDSNAKNTPIPFAPAADASILPIVTSQRDRFRQRNAELEEVGVSKFIGLTLDSFWCRNSADNSRPFLSYAQRLRHCRRTT